MTSLAEWQNFYVVMGSAGAALTGLQFVVMALIADIPMRPGENETGEAFATPTIVHFVSALMLAASAVVPWHGLGPAAVLWALGGMAGLVYMGAVVLRMVRQTGYQPVLEDWIFHTILPVVAYAGLPVSALCLRSHARGSLFGLAAVVVLLLVIGIHNSWDNVTFIVMMKRERTHEAPLKHAATPEPQ